jgi:hypothetical protein
MSSPSKGKGKARANESSDEESGTLFGQPYKNLTTTILKRILAMYYKKSKASERKSALLERVTRLASEMRNDDINTITQLLAQNKEITRKALEDGRQQEKNVGDEEEVVAEGAEAPNTTGPERQDAGNVSTQDDFPQTKHACSVCASQPEADDITDIHLPPKSNMAEKSHKICKSCVTSLIRSQIDMIQWVKLGYITSFHHSMLMRALPEDVPRLKKFAIPAIHFESLRLTHGMFRYEEYEEALAYKEDRNFCWCLNPECGSGQADEVDEADVGLIMTCKKCGMKTCSSHQILLDGEESCQKCKDEEEV